MDYKEEVKGSQDFEGDEPRQFTILAISSAQQSNFPLLNVSSEVDMAQSIKPLHHRRATSIALPQSVGGTAVCSSADQRDEACKSDLWYVRGPKTTMRFRKNLSLDKRG